MKTLTSLALALSLAAPVDHVPAADTRRANFHGIVHVDADGRLRVESIEGITRPLADAVRSQLEARHATPALRDGVPLAARAPLAGTVILTPNGEQVTIGLQDVVLHPAVRKYAPISYPSEAMRNDRAGWVEVEFAIDATGAPVDVAVVQASHPVFAKAIGRPFGLWRFHTGGVQPVQRHRATVTFATAKKTPTPAFLCPVDASRPRMPDQTGCLGGVSVHGEYGGPQVRIW